MGKQGGKEERGHIHTVSKDTQRQVKTPMTCWIWMFGWLSCSTQLEAKLSVSEMASLAHRERCILYIKCVIFSLFAGYCRLLSVSSSLITLLLLPLDSSSHTGCPYAVCSAEPPLQRLHCQHFSQSLPLSAQYIPQWSFPFSCYSV